MASSLHSNLAFLSPSLTSTTKIYRAQFTVRCGPRDNRGPLMKGRVLSIEAIQAVQSLKRAHKSSNHDSLSKTLSRLVKSDLIATFNELLRQDQTDLALLVFSAVRSEDWYKTDLSLYANLVSVLAKRGLREDIDRLISELDGEGEGVIPCDGKGLVMLIKALLAADRALSTVRIYRMMKRNGWAPTCSADDFVLYVLSSGLRRLGEERVAEEIDRDFGRASKGNIDNVDARRLDIEMSTMLKEQLL